MNPRALCLCGLSIATACATAQPQHPAPAHAPDWLDLASASAYSTEHGGQVLLVLHRGEPIFEHCAQGWSVDRAHPLASGTKSFTGVLAMAAVQDGLISLDERVADTITEWYDDPRKGAITVRHLLTLSSGLDAGFPDLSPRSRGGGGARERLDTFKTAVDVPAVHTPGSRFEYGPAHFYAFGEFLQRKLASSDRPEQTFAEYLQSRYFDALELDVASFRMDAAGNPGLPGGASLSARDWARFGEFIRNRGAVVQPDGTSRQIIEWEFLKQCFEPSAANPSYGLTWWLRTEAEGEAMASILQSQDARAQERERGSIRERLRRRALERAAETRAKDVVDAQGNPLDLWMAAGAGRQRLYVLPGQDLVVVRFAPIESGRRGYQDSEFLRRLLRIAEPAATDAK